MRDFFGELHCACLSFDLVLVPVTTPDDRMDITGHWVTCVGCSGSFHDRLDPWPTDAARGSAADAVAVAVTEPPSSPPDR